jgi:uracil phosphoribosyltransferase
MARKLKNLSDLHGGTTFSISSSRNFVLIFIAKKRLYTMIMNLGGQRSIANVFLRELRDKTVQRDRARFRRNMERLGEIMAYEVSKKLAYTETAVETVLGTAPMMLPAEQPVLVTVLRAGLPYFQGFLNYFDRSDCGFIGAYREEGKSEVSIKLDYQTAPVLKGRALILIDPMLATGKSLVRAIQSLTDFYGEIPDHIHLASLIATPEGIRYIQEHVPLPHTIWTFSIDEKLDEKFYIVPGLGDAGDLSYGNKV